MKTAALAAYVQSRNMKFAGAPLTLDRLLKMWQLPHDGTRETIGGAALKGVARYCKLSVAELTAAVEAVAPPEPPAPLPLPPPPPAPIPQMTFATVQIPPIVTQNPPAPAPTPEASKSVPEPTMVIPKDQLSDLVAASRRSSPVIEAAAAVSDTKAADHEDDIEISFDGVEATSGAPTTKSGEQAREQS